jgi:hypothetical protein
MKIASGDLSAWWSFSVVVVRMVFSRESLVSLELNTTAISVTNIVLLSLAARTEQERSEQQEFSRASATNE